MDLAERSIGPLFAYVHAESSVSVLAWDLSLSSRKTTSMHALGVVQHAETSAEVEFLLKAHNLINSCLNSVTPSVGCSL